MPHRKTALPSHFNPLPRKEGDRCSTGDKLHRKYFNPLPRKEGDGWRMWQLSQKR